MQRTGHFGQGLLTRRQVLQGAVAAATLSALPATRPTADDGLTLVARERPTLLPGCNNPSPLWTLADDRLLVLRTPRGKPFSALLDNRLPEHTTLHWHGLRIPLDMDGVPYISQPPVLPGQRFSYTFTPPDPGTFFFHPHCNTAEQLGRGMAGVLLVEDEREAGLYDAEYVLALKDWRTRPDGGFEPFITDAGAAKAGTFGDLRTVNGDRPPTIKVQPGASVRLRIVNLDVTRINMLVVAGAEAMVVATDGNACEPFTVKGWWLGPAMRADVVFVAPDRPGAEVHVADVWPKVSERLALFVTEGAPARPGGAGGVPRLPAAELPEPDLVHAEPLSFTLQAGIADPAYVALAQELGIGPEALCLSQHIFWSINKAAWPGLSHDNLPPPLFELKSGRSYVAEVFNATPHRHPMHLHGHTFRVLGSSERKLPPHWADTVMVGPKERLRIAFVAGLPGDWMFHCHVIEHQETGMMGYLRVA